jgi:hypothetical protein
MDFFTTSHRVIINMAHVARVDFSPTHSTPDQADIYFASPSPATGAILKVFNEDAARLWRWLCAYSPE